MTSRAAVPPWGLAVAAMFSVQLGSALSVHLISTAGPAGTAWLRLSMGALIFLALAGAAAQRGGRRVPELVSRPQDQPFPARNDSRERARDPQQSPDLPGNVGGLVEDRGVSRLGSVSYGDADA